MAEETPAPRGKEKPFTFFFADPEAEGYNDPPDPNRIIPLYSGPNGDYTVNDCPDSCCTDYTDTGDAEPCGCDADITCLTHSEVVHLQRRCRCGTTDGSDGCRG